MPVCNENDVTADWYDWDKYAFGIERLITILTSFGIPQDGDDSLEYGAARYDLTFDESGKVNDQTYMKFTLNGVQHTVFVPCGVIKWFQDELTFYWNQQQTKLNG